MTRAIPPGSTTRHAGWRALVAACLLVLGPAVSVAAQPRTVREPGRLPWVVGGWWRQGEGLPQDRVYAIHQARDGYVWVGTRGGVARFDGVRFTTWQPAGEGSIPDGEVFDVAETRDGTLWLAVYGGGLTRYRDGRFSTLTTEHGLVDPSVRCLAVSADGAIWAGTDRGLGRYLNGGFTNYRAADGLRDASVRALLAEDDGTVWVGTNGGLQRLSGGRFERVTLTDGPGDPVVEGLARDRTGRVWVATSLGVFCLKQGQVTSFGPADGLSSRVARAVAEDATGRIWVATSRGLDYTEPQTGTRPVFAGAVTSADVTALSLDREQGIWVGYRGHGLARLRRSLFRVYDAAAGLPAGTTTTVFESRDRTIWVGAGNQLSAIRGSRIDSFGTADGLPDAPVSSLAQDAAGRLWVGTEAGLYRSVAEIRCGGSVRCAARFVAVLDHPALRTHVRVLRPDGESVMLAGTNASGVIAVAVPPSAQPASVVVPGEIRALVRESPDRIWIGRHDGGLLRWTPSGTTAFTTREGLAHDRVYALHLDREGTLWIGTRGGLSWIRDGRLTSVTRAQGLWENHIYGITEDRNGRLWLSSGSGIFTLVKAELHDFAAGQRSRIISAAYGLEHGLVSTLGALSHDPVAMTDADGHVWVATLGGVVRTDPDAQRIAPVAPPVHIEAVSVGQTLFRGTREVETTHARGALAFAFAAPGFRAPERIVFRYRLEGFDPGWVEGGTSREARFTNIPPGRYRFIVEARSNDGAWAGSSASVDVYLVPRFYQRGWFAALVVVAIAGVGLGAGLGVHRVRVRRLRARQIELSQRIEEALAHIKVLRGLLPICAWCRRVRDDTGYWTQMETYVREHSHAEFSHGLCPDCLKEHFPEEAHGLSPGDLAQPS